MKINITGSAGAGKTTWAKRFGAALQLPVYHLDSAVWQPGWEKTPPVRRAQLEQEMVSQPRWVIDGVSDFIRTEADLVVVLAVPRWRCLLQAFRRNLPYLFRSRPELPPGCPEILILPTLIRMIMRHPKTLAPKLLAEAGCSSRYHVLHTNAELQALLQLLEVQMNGASVKDHE